MSADVTNRSLPAETPPLKSTPTVQFQVESQPVGFSIDAYEEGETATVVTHALLTDDDGSEFVSVLNNMQWLFAKANLSPNQVHRALIILEPKLTTIYANGDLRLAGLVRVREKVEAGQALHADQVVGYERLEFEGVTIPNGAGVVMFLSHGWRRGMFFDFRPLKAEFPARTYEETVHLTDSTDFNALAGALMSQLVFAEFFSLDQSDWDLVFEANWFPFLYLRGEDWNFLLNRLRRGRSVDGIESRIRDHLKERVDSRLSSWITNPLLLKQKSFLELAVKHFKSDDWISCASVLVPRIEGILAAANGQFYKHRKTIEEFCKSTQTRAPERSLLFANELERYFKEVLFRDTDFNSADSAAIPSRHTIGHGVVEPSSVDSMFATKLLLLIDHLFYCLPKPEA